MKNWITKSAVLAATGFGLGYSPVASGTVGCLLGVALVALTFRGLPLPHQIGLAAALTLLAVPICDVAEKKFGVKDDGRIVADEYLTFPVCMIGLPPTPGVLALAFVTNRVFDIVKPPPARGLQRLHGGWGIVVDDLLAALYSLALNHLLYRLLVRALGPF